MFGPEHYLSKIERNMNVLDKAAPEIRNNVIEHIKWARELSSRLGQLDYEQRQTAINHIHTVLDKDYMDMGFVISNELSEKKRLV